MALADIIATEKAENGFYPTPRKLAEELLAGVEWEKIKTVLEPSAGKGDLIDCVAEKSRLHYEDVEVDAIEIDPYLRSIVKYEFGEEKEEVIRSRKRVLEDKQCWDYTTQKRGELTEEEEFELKCLAFEYHKLNSVTVRVVHDDFLGYESMKHYDLIVMNPPFADGDAHLLKAIQMQERSGGVIRCLLNAETILNPYTNRRKALKQKLSELGAEVSFEEGAFTDGERETDVTVAIIKLTVPEQKRESEVFTRLRKAAGVEEEAVNISDLCVSDFVERIVAQFNIEVNAGISLIREYNAMKPYILDSFDEKKASWSKPTLALSVEGTCGCNINDFLKCVRLKYWSELFRNEEFMGKLTSNLRQEYLNRVSDMKHYDFTLFNIRQVWVQMNAEMGESIQDTIVSLFDRMTEQHSWYPETQKNIHYYNGWKTNKVHKINSKVILPVNGMFSDYSWSETFEVRHAEEVISDIEKVFDYFCADSNNSFSLHGVLRRACDEGRTKNIQCKYFDVTLYKKGTMHIKFHNQELVDRFNIYCGRQKNWLPPSYGKAAYADMSAEEQTVVDSFHGDGSEGSGCEEYGKVMEGVGYYLCEPTQNLPALALAG